MRGLVVERALPIAPFRADVLTVPVIIKTTAHCEIIFMAFIEDCVRVDEILIFTGHR